MVQEINYEPVLDKDHFSGLHGRNSHDGEKLWGGRRRKQASTRGGEREIDVCKNVFRKDMVLPKAHTSKHFETDELLASSSLLPVIIVVLIYYELQNLESITLSRNDNRTAENVVLPLRNYKHI